MLLSVLDLSAGKKFVANTTVKTRVQPEQLLTKPLRWAEIDYTQVNSPDCEGHVKARAMREGQASAIVVWFATCLLGDIGFSNAPGQPRTIFGMLRFPLPSPTPVWRVTRSKCEWRRISTATTTFGDGTRAYDLMRRIE